MAAVELQAMTDDAHMPPFKNADMPGVSQAAIRTWRLRLMNVPLLSLVLFRWLVHHGSVVVDGALTHAAAERRAKAYIGNCGRWNDLRRPNSVQVTRCDKAGRHG